MQTIENVLTIVWALRDIELVLALAVLGAFYAESIHDRRTQRAGLVKARRTNEILVHQNRALSAGRGNAHGIVGPVR